MLESIASILVLIGLEKSIGDMARRRGRSPLAFGLLLLLCCGGGFIAASAVLGYGLRFIGAALGVGLAFWIARSFEPIDGVYREVVAEAAPKDYYLPQWLGWTILGAVLLVVLGVLVFLP